jgi:hypothetical protein
MGTSFEMSGNGLRLKNDADSRGTSQPQNSVSR